MNKRLKYFGPILILVIMLILASGCDQGGNITIQNLQNQEVTIFFIHVRADGSLDTSSKQGIVPPNATKRFGDVFLGSEWVERIEAQNPIGKVVFSHHYKMADLEKINWEIVIRP